MAEKQNVYVSYCIYKSVLPVHVAHRRLAKTNLTIDADVLLISGGYIDDRTPEPLLLQTGVIGAGPLGWTAAERIVSTLVCPEDLVLIVDEAHSWTLKKWEEACSHADVELIRSRDCILLRTTGSQLDCLPWIHDLLPCSLTTLFAFPGSSSSLRSELKDALMKGERAMEVIHQLDRLLEHDPRAALATLNDYRVWAWLGGFDGEDVVVIGPSLDEDTLATAFRELSQCLDVPVYCGGVHLGQESVSSPTDGETWRSLPRSWQRIR